MVKFFFLFSSSVITLLLIWHFSTRKYLNPYKLIFIFAKKGQGKLFSI